ncbi:MAG: hypothetical protein AAFY48_03790 [Bacteroidota bacterium]
MKKLITCCVLVALCSVLWSATVYDSLPETDCCTLEVTPHGNSALEMLPGDWQKGFSNDDPFLSFNADGTYSIADLSEAGYLVKSGRWTLADDGNTLLLHSAEGDLIAYTIKYLELDELVLSPVKGECADWFLSKI